MSLLLVLHGGTVRMNTTTSGSHGYPALERACVFSDDAGLFESYAASLHLAAQLPPVSDSLTFPRKSAIESMKNS